MRLRELDDSYRASRMSLVLALALVAVVGASAALLKYNIAGADARLDRRTAAAVTSLLDARRADVAVALGEIARLGIATGLPASAQITRLSADGVTLSRPGVGYVGRTALGAVLAEHVRRERGTGRVATGFVSIEGATSLVGLAPVSVGPDAGTWIAVTQVLNPRYLTEIAVAADLGGLSLAPAGAPHVLSVPLASFDGRPTAMLAVAFPADPAVNLRRWALAAGLILAALLAVALLAVHRRMVGVGRRIAAFEIESHRRASEDVLTGVANRAAFMEGLSHHLEKGLGSPPFTVALVDLDHFKAVNDTFGHAAGDALLAEIGRRLAAIAPAGALVARLGGDEFGVLAPGLTGPEHALAFGRAICEAVGAPVALNGVELHVGASVGLARAPADGIERSYLMRCADVALYASKAEGRGRAELFDVAMEDDRRHRKSLARQLHAALLLDEFALAYQPIFSTEDGAVRGVEVLLRWNHSYRGAVSPDEFIPIAEESDLIVRIGAWVLERALAEAAAWPDIYLSINVSPVELARGDYPVLLARALEKSGFPSDRLVVEITEGKLLSRADAMLRALEDVRALGVRIAIDDFGTGWSSLGYLTRFRFDRLKIDRSFVTEVAHRPEQAIIVRAVAGLARGLDLGVIAEGVETDEDLAFVRTAGIGEAQGFGLSRPMTAAAFGRLLAGRGDPDLRAA